MHSYETNTRTFQVILPIVRPMVSLSRPTVWTKRTRSSSRSYQEMYEVAEYRVAAHWAYKKNEGQVNSKGICYQDERIKEMMELQDRKDDAKGICRYDQRNYLAEEIYVFSDGAVPFSSRIQDRLTLPIKDSYQDWEKATGAKVNGRMVPLTTKLKTGDRLKSSTNQIHLDKPRLAQYG